MANGSRCPGLDHCNSTAVEGKMRSCYGSKRHHFERSSGPKWDPSDGFSKKAYDLMGSLRDFQEFARQKSLDFGENGSRPPISTDRVHRLQSNL